MWCSHTLEYPWKQRDMLLSVNIGQISKDWAEWIGETEIANLRFYLYGFLEKENCSNSGQRLAGRGWNCLWNVGWGHFGVMEICILMVEEVTWPACREILEAGLCPPLLSCLATQLCSTVWDRGLAAPGSSVSVLSKKTGVGCHSISGDLQPRDQTTSPCVGRWILYHWVSRKPVVPLPTQKYPCALLEWFYFI